MAAPKKPNTAAATAANIRRGHDRAALRLTKAGWLVLDPTIVNCLPQSIIDKISLIVEQQIGVGQ